MRQQFHFRDLLVAFGAIRGLRDQPRNIRQDWMLFCLSHAARSHSQFFQDIWVLHQLNELRGGFFVEFGAADGLNDSNTALLERDYDWTGILAEPARRWRSALRRNRRCAIDERCVWLRTGETVSFRETEIPAHSTMEQYAGDDSLADERVSASLYPVETVSLSDLLIHWNAPRRIDYLSLDTEGSELDILSAFDFDAWDVRLISVEHNNSARRTPLFDLLTQNGYQRVLEGLSGVDDWYVKVASDLAQPPVASTEILG